MNSTNVRRRELPGSITANSKQEALFVFFYSPEYMIGYIPENLEKYPDLLKFMVDISMTWEESIVLDSKPGDYVVYDRKDKYGVWYIVDISDEEEREVTLDLTFLQKGKKIPCPFCYRCH